MKQILEKAKIWFLDTFDRIVEFCTEKWEEQRLVCIVVLAGLLIIILLLILIPVAAGSGASARQVQLTPIEGIELEPFLSIPSEPHIEDEYMYSRKNVTRWSDDAIDEWFSEPDDSMLEDLKKANNKLVDDMMEVVP